MMCDNSFSRPLLVCKMCLKTKDIRRCSRCQTAYYCSTECQRADWPSHRQECHQRSKMHQEQQQQILAAIQPTSSTAGFHEILTAPIQEVQVQQPNIVNNYGMSNGDFMNDNNFMNDIVGGVGDVCMGVDNICSTTTNDSNNMLPMENETSLDDGLRDELNELLSDIDLTNFQFNINNQIDFNVDTGETMILGNENMYNPELNLQFR